MPVSIPKVSRQTLERWRQLSYTDLAVEVMSKFIGNTEIPRSRLRRLVEKSYGSVRPSVRACLRGGFGAELLLLYARVVIGVTTTTTTTTTTTPIRPPNTHKSSCRHKNVVQLVACAVRVDGCDGLVVVVVVCTRINGQSSINNYSTPACRGRPGPLRARRNTGFRRSTWYR